MIFLGVSRKFFEPRRGFLRGARQFFSGVRRFFYAGCGDFFRCTPLYYIYRCILGRVFAVVSALRMALCVAATAINRIDHLRAKIAPKKREKSLMRNTQ